MLILSRNIGEAIHIGNDIKWVILDVQDNQVRMGINALRGRTSSPRRNLSSNQPAGAGDTKMGILHKLLHRKFKPKVSSPDF